MYMHEAESWLDVSNIDKTVFQLMMLGMCAQLDVKGAFTDGMHITTLLLYLVVSKRQGSTAVVPCYQQKTR